jgi:hypothetical protein
MDDRTPYLFYIGLLIFAGSSALTYLLYLVAMATS